jgi:N utilization substance protein B
MATSYTRPEHEEVPILKIENEEIFDNDPERDKHLSRRRLARERVLQVIYSHQMNDRDTDELFFEMIQSDALLNEQSREFARQLVRNYNVHKNDLNEIITKHLAHWDVSRVALIDKILIQIGILEFKYFPEVPPKATINELIEIAKDFSTDDSGKFINGILHAIKEDLSNAGEMKKEGRGLLEQSL